MLDGAKGVLIAVSGGADSVALMDMLARISRGDREAKWNGRSEELTSREVFQPLSAPSSRVFVPRLHIAHIDHQLRGLESAEDAEFVRALAEEFGLQVTISKVDVQAAAASSGRGIEEMAREIRYNFLLAVANDTGCDRIAVGHTMTDQAETFLMRLIRGAGLRGLSAMRPVVPAHRFGRASEEKAEGRRQKAEARRQKAESRRQKAEDGTEKAEGGARTAADSDPSAFCLLPSVSDLPPVSIIRPLLGITREEVEAYCSQHGLRFRTDTTNLGLQYTRNRLRHDVLPALAAINPRIVESISRLAENISGDQAVLDDLALSLLQRTRLEQDDWRAGAEKMVFAYSISALLEQPVAIRRRLIIEAIRLARAAATGEDGELGGEVNFVHVASLEGLLTGKTSGKQIDLPGSLEAWRESDALVLRPSRNKKKALYREMITSESHTVVAGGFAFTLERGLPAEMIESVIKGVRQGGEETGRDWTAVALDDRTLPSQLVVRPRLRGERAHVIGRRRTIKLKNLMIGHKIPSSRRATWPLVATPDGAYIWSPGLPPSVEFAAHDKTTSLATMRASAI